ncbi:MAG: hypothetical protein ACE5J3_05240, partial [Methanosarcinales archaeon]
KMRHLSALLPVQLLNKQISHYTFVFVILYKVFGYMNNLCIYSYYNILIYDCRDFCKYCYLDASIVYPFKKDVTINFFCGKKIKKPRPTRRKDYAFSCAYLDARGIKHRLD